MKIIITIHGIRTFGQWQQRLERVCKAEAPDLVFYHYSYGYFSVLAFLFPPFRYLAVRRFASFLTQVQATHPNQTIHIVSHSFGTHLTGWGIYRLAQVKKVSLGNIILAGSVLRVTFPWQELIDRGVVRKVVNDCGIGDSILILSQFFVLLTGMAGRLGFQGGLNDRFMNRYFEGGHSLYFVERDNPSDEIMKEFWVPVLLRDEVVAYDARQSKGPLQGAIITILQIADPIKLLAYGSIVWWLLSLFYLEPKSREARAVASERENLAGRLFEADSSLNTALDTLVRANSDSLSTIDYIQRVFAARFDYLPRAHAGRYSRVLRYWLAVPLSFDEAMMADQLRTTVSGSVILKSNGQMRRYDGPGIVRTFHDPKNSRLFLYESNGVLSVFDAQKMTLQFFIDLKSGRSSTSAGEASDVSEPLFGRLSDLRLFSHSADYTLAVGYTEASYAGGVERRLLIIDHLRNRASVLWDSLHTMPTTEISHSSRCTALRLNPDHGFISLAEGGASSSALPMFRPKRPRQELCIQGELAEFPATSLVQPAAGSLEERGINREANIAPEAFPRFASESSFWEIVDDAAVPTPNSDEIDRPDESDHVLSEPTIDQISVVDGEPIGIERDAYDRYFAEKNFAHLENPPSMSGREIDDLSPYLFPVRISDGSDTIIFATGAEGKYVGVELCRMGSSLRAVACTSFGVPRGGNVWASLKEKLAIVRSYNVLGSNAFNLIKLDTMQEVLPLVTPPTSIVGARIGPDRFSVTTNEGQLWIYDRKSLTVAERVQLGWSQDSFDSPRPMTIAGNPIRLGADSSISLLDGLSGRPMWLSRPLQGRPTSIALSSDENTIAVMDDSGQFRFIDASTGLSLIRPIRQSEVCKESYSGTKAKIGFIQKNDNFAIRCGSSKIAVRRGPLQQDAYDSRTMHLSNYIIPEGGSSALINRIPPLELPPNAPPSNERTNPPKPVATAPSNEPIRSKSTDDGATNVEWNNEGVVFFWPVRGKIVSNFGGTTNGQSNDGINLAVPEGTPVKAVDDGEVAYSGDELKNYGNLIVLRHKDGLVTGYAHLSELLVTRGSQVKRGEIIGRSGQSGAVNSPQLHFEVRKGAVPVHPLSYLRAN